MKLKIDTYKWFFATIGLLIIAGAFYWFSYRPMEIKKNCSWIKDYTEEKKEVSKEQVDKAKAKYKMYKEYQSKYGDKYDLEYNQCYEVRLDKYLESYSMSLSGAKATKYCDETISIKLPQNYREFVGKDSAIDEFNYQSASSNEEQKYEPSKEYWRKASTQEYNECLRSEGI